MDFFAAQLQGAKIELYVMVRTKNDDVLGDVRAIVRTTKRLDVMCLCICAAIGQAHGVTAQLAKVLVKKFDLSRQFRVAKYAIHIGMDSTRCFRLCDVAGDGRCSEM